MSSLPPSVDYLTSAAASAAKARSVPPVTATRDPLDVATALKCLTVFQTMKAWEDLARFDEEAYAAPLVAAARTLQSTSQHRRKAAEPAEQIELDELSFYAALGYAMHGNFPSAKAVLSEVSPEFLASTPAVRMAAIVCDATRVFGNQPVDANSQVEAFKAYWRGSLTDSSREARQAHFTMALATFREVVWGTGGTGAGFALHVRMAAHQASRLATANLLEDAPEIPSWFVLNAVRTGMATLLPPQRQLLADKRIAWYPGNTLLTLPTSTGKTFVAEACMAASLEGGGLSVYVAPYVAVGEQVKASLDKVLDQWLPYVSMFGGFKTDSIDTSAGAEVIVATPERFDAWLRTGDGVDRLRTVVFDEIHIVENGSRGARMEGLVSRLRMLQADNPRLRILGLSAVLSETAEVCNWLGVLPEALHQIGWRPTARRLGMVQSDGLMYWVHGNDALRPASAQPNTVISSPVQFQFEALPFNQFGGEKEAARNVAKIAQDLFYRLGSPGLVVCPRKSDTRMLAKALKVSVPQTTDAMVLATADSIVARYPWLSALADVLRCELAYHNASLPYDVRRDIEELTRQRKLKVVCSTTTLAEGADLPFRWTIVSHYLMSLRDAGTPMKSMTFRNIAGRCGRAGAFSEGDTVLYENLLGRRSARLNTRSSQPHVLTSVMFSSSPLESTMGSSWDASEPAQQAEAKAAFAAQLMACIGEHPTLDDIVSRFAESTYAQLVGGRDRLHSLLSETLSEMLDDSRPGGALAVANSPVRLTEFGEAANRSGFSPATCRRLVAFLSNERFAEGPTLYAELIREFADIPEQSNGAIRKIVDRDNHRHPVKDQHLESVIEDLLAPLNLREAFDRLRAKSARRSNAGEDYVDKQFDNFVSFSTDIIGHFLPWLLRGLEALSRHGTEEAFLTSWVGMARHVEGQLQRAANASDVVDDIEGNDDEL